MSVFKGSPLGELPRLRNVRTRRVSSWDTTGGNQGFIVIEPESTVTLAGISGAGRIRAMEYRTKDLKTRILSSEEQTSAVKAIILYVKQRGGGITWAAILT